MRARRSQAWLLSFALAVAAPGARRLCAQVAESAGLQLEYRAPDGCPDRARFEQRLRARLPRRGAGRLRLAVRITLAASGAIGELSLARPHGAAAVRKLTAADCGEAVEALALVAALMLEPPAEARAPSAAGPRHGASEARATPGEVERDTPAASHPGAEALANSAEAQQSMAGVEASDRGEDMPATRETATQQPAVMPSSRISAPERATVAPARRQIALGAAAVVATGVAPSPRAGGTFTLALLSWRARLELAARLGVRVVQRYASEREEGHVEMRWWSGSGSLCAGTLLGARGALDGCLSGELGRSRARGSDTSMPSSSDRVWSALGPALLGRWRVLGPLALEAGLHALFPLVRHRYVLGEESVHSVPRLTFRGELGVLLQFP